MNAPIPDWPPALSPKPTTGFMRLPSVVIWGEGGATLSSAPDRRLSARHRHTLLDANGTALSEQQLQSTWRRSVQRTLHAVDRLQPGVSVLC